MFQVDKKLCFVRIEVCCKSTPDAARGRSMQMFNQTSIVVHF